MTRTSLIWKPQKKRDKINTSFGSWRHNSSIMCFTWLYRKDGLHKYSTPKKEISRSYYILKKGKLMILGLSNTPKSGGWLFVTIIDIGLNNDFDNWFRASGVCKSKTKLRRFWKTNQLKEPCFWKSGMQPPLWHFLLKWLNNILFNGDIKHPF